MEIVRITETFHTWRESVQREWQLEKQGVRVLNRQQYPWGYTLEYDVFVPAAERQVA